VMFVEGWQPRRASERSGHLLRVVGGNARRPLSQASPPDAPAVGLPTRELRTPRTLGFHEVRGVQHWVSSLKREAFFGPLGVTEIKTYVDAQGSERVRLTMNVPDLEAMMGEMQT